VAALLACDVIPLFPDPDDAAGFIDILKKVRRHHPRARSAATRSCMPRTPMLGPVET
jgi:hypothetical protein